MTFTDSISEKIFEMELNGCVEYMREVHIYAYEYATILEKKMEEVVVDSFREFFDEHAEECSYDVPVSSSGMKKILHMHNSAVQLLQNTWIHGREFMIWHRNNFDYRAMMKLNTRNWIYREHKKRR